ncbi:hypothetical protein BOTBODRAFT_117451 [Botryobasidium botryosum FD-172 SS1]|uniref:DUF2461 domain-containing protein n=1 Tax=Botryobasidium botryosum (strain FD-172 SS1) TaxID=930990 RepID=A0A067M3B2_BOTB1|nr:hypothetical protein BOTBODRAFT_117451 [Botryobasidium botryosum FD-172 SS1]
MGRTKRLARAKATVPSANTSSKSSKPLPKKRAKKDRDSSAERSEGEGSSRLDEDPEEGRGGAQREPESVDSDALDDSDFEEKVKVQKKAQAKKKATPVKRPVKGKRKRAEESDEESGDEGGVTVIGNIVEAPKEGRVPPGRISQNTLNFLGQLADPEYNDREWFRLNVSSPVEPVFRLAEKEFSDFIEKLVPIVSEVDEEVPPLPPRDLIYRIYRDIRFSNDKTPYKKFFCATFSRTGRKTKFAGLKPGGSFLAGGGWQCEQSQLGNIRTNILRNPSRLRQVISAPAFVELFGEAKPHPKGKRQNIFGHEDALKVAPKGVDKTHKDIDLLKLRTWVVETKFTDAEVLDPNFLDHLRRVMVIMEPFVNCLNDMMTIIDDDEDGGEGANDEEDGNGEASGDDDDDD